MRNLIRFPCGDAMLSGSLDDAHGHVGLICVTGGRQTRYGPHRMLHRLAIDVAAAGFPVFRYERRGVGDSEGKDPGYRESGPDLAAAVVAFRKAVPRLRTVVGFGLCDGATTLALHGAEAGVDGIMLANPWLVETASGELAPAAARVYYRRRFFSLDAWSSLLRGRVDVVGGARSWLGATNTKKDELPDAVAHALLHYIGKTALVIAEDDGTAIAAKACWNSAAYAHLREAVQTTVATNAHTFARVNDMNSVTKATLDLIHNIGKTS